MRSILRSFPTEKVKLIKKDGSIFENIEALVQTVNCISLNLILKWKARTGWFTGRSIEEKMSRQLDYTVL